MRLHEPLFAARVVVVVSGLNEIRPFEFCWHGAQPIATIHIGPNTRQEAAGQDFVGGSVLHLHIPHGGDAAVRLGFALGAAAFIGVEAICKDRPRISGLEPPATFANHNSATLRTSASVSF